MQFSCWKQEVSQHCTTSQLHAGHQQAGWQITGTLNGVAHLFLSFCWLLADSVFFPGFSTTVLGDDSGCASGTEGLSTSFSSFGCSGTELTLSLSANKPLKKNKHWEFSMNDNLQRSQLNKTQWAPRTQKTLQMITEWCVKTLGI